MIKKKECSNFAHSIVLYNGNERLVHRFTDGGSQVELACIAGGETFGSGIRYEIEHDGACPNDVFQFLGLQRFLTPEVVG